jgi:putative Ig domain-containing protein
MLTPLRALLAAIALAVVLGWGASGAAVRAAPRVTLVADSVGGVLFWQRQARDELGRGIDFRIDIRTCRRLVSEGCVYDGERPPSVLEAIGDLGSALGQVAVIEVGYNDAASGFAAGIDRVMRALVDAGVDQVVWITLRERQASWADINDQIREARKRWPQLAVGDWEFESRDHDEWFADGIHMNWDGGEAFTRFLRPLVVGACGPACVEGGSILTVGGPLRWARSGMRYVDRIRISGGTPPYRLTVKGLPAPLRVLRDGTIVGRPKAAGTYSLEVDVVDVAGIRNRATVTLKVVRRLGTGSTNAR